MESERQEKIEAIAEALEQATGGRTWLSGSPYSFGEPLPGNPDDVIFRAMITFDTEVNTRDSAGKPTTELSEEFKVYSDRLKDVLYPEVDTNDLPREQAIEQISLAMGMVGSVYSVRYAPAYTRDEEWEKHDNRFAWATVAISSDTLENIPAEKLVEKAEKLGAVFREPSDKFTELALTGEIPSDLKKVLAERQSPNLARDAEKGGFELG